MCLCWFEVKPRFPSLINSVIVSSSVVHSVSIHNFICIFPDYEQTGRVTLVYSCWLTSWNPAPRNTASTCFSCLDSRIRHSTYKRKALPCLKPWLFHTSYLLLLHTLWETPGGGIISNIRQWALWVSLSDTHRFMKKQPSGPLMEMPPLDHKQLMW